ncbi:hypothetical protein PVW47_12590 [Marinovum sp. SP66]|uniref:hypothetical protein n=1 Tax=Marinovum TaxID=367771 RepID=UPI00237B879C|nr:hypothetical protein [Marinovum sp. SP66]MDD9740616.1 hypothetical protein [Marinovum sp. SP66]
MPDVPRSNPITIILSCPLSFALTLPRDAQSQERTQILTYVPQKILGEKQIENDSAKDGGGRHRQPVGPRPFAKVAGMEITPTMPRLQGYRCPPGIVANAVFSFRRFAVGKADVEELPKRLKRPSDRRRAGNFQPKANGLAMPSGPSRNGGMKPAQVLRAAA